MDAREELRELIHQAKEHLLYYRDLGLTNIGEAEKPAAAESLAIASEEKAVSVPPLEPAIITSPAITQPEIMKKEPATTSLFGEESIQPATVIETLEDIRRDLGDCQRCKL
ncbi:MAG: hypothetical protein ACRD82_24200, partial [Blastocatellia bacterium]